MTPDEVLTELRRTLRIRQEVYPHWVKQGRLTQETADHQVEAIEWAIDVIEECKPLEPVQQDLFGGER